MGRVEWLRVGMVGPRTAPGPHPSPLPPSGRGDGCRVLGVLQ